jgi:hypothetical protein
MNRILSALEKAMNRGTQVFIEQVKVTVSSARPPSEDKNTGTSR